jgi:hypothetical protein
MNYRLEHASIVFKNIIRGLSIIARYACITLCFLGLFEAIKAFAGKETNAYVLINLLTEMKIDKWIAYIFLGCGFVYGSVRNHQLKQTRKNLGEHISNVEKKIDPARQNSRLTKYGETNEDDR